MAGFGEERCGCGCGMAGWEMVLLLGAEVLVAGRRVVG